MACHSKRHVIKIPIFWAAAVYFQSEEFKVPFFLYLVSMPRVRLALHFIRNNLDKGNCSQSTLTFTAYSITDESRLTGAFERPDRVVTCGVSVAVMQTIGTLINI